MNKTTKNLALTTAFECTFGRIIDTVVNEWDQRN